MNAAIIGDGFAGQVAVWYLRNYLQKHVTAITVISPPALSMSGNVSKHSKLYSGIWKPSNHALKRLLGDEYHTKIGNLLTPVLESGYRSQNGHWLARPSTPRSFESSSLSFVSDKALLSAFTQENINDLNIKYINQSLKNISAHPTSRQKFIIEMSNDRIEADLIIAADGYRSRIRSLVHQNQNNVKYQEHVVFRGIAELSIDYKPLPSFQTWGHGCRFACIPVDRAHNDQSSIQSMKYQWFASIEHNSLPQPFLNDLNNIRNTFSNNYHEELSSTVHSYIKLIQSRGTIHSSDIINDKHQCLSSWHSPIEDLIQHTDINTINITPVYASDKVSHGLSGYYSINKSGNLIQSTSDGVPIIFVGDAAHTGAGLAIEDIDTVGGLINTHGISPITLETYETIRYQRRRRLQYLTKLVNLFSRMTNKQSIILRDNMLKYCPEMIKTIIFDSFINYAMK